MKILYSFFFILAYINMQVEGQYERHNQFCGGMNGSDVKWALDIKKNKTYSLKIIVKKNEYLSEPKTTIITGTWQIQADTLKLSSWDKSGEQLIFHKRDERLLFQSSKSKVENKDLVYLDYLERSIE